MKKAKMMVFALIDLMTKSLGCNASDKMVLAKDLPAKVKAFVQHNFPRQSVAYAETRTTDKGKEYVVSLNNGTEVVFNQKGVWSMVDCKSEAVPSSLMPAALPSFLGSLFSDKKVVKLNRTDSGYVAALSNGYSLKLDHEGMAA